MSSAFVSKGRRVRFELTLRIIDLNNVPLVSGTSFVKWHLPSSTAAEHRGRTQKCAITDHRVQYEYKKQTTVRLVVGKERGVLEECPIQFEILQEYSSAGRGERLTLGHIKLNLAEYVDASDAQSPGGTADADAGITRRYLMQDSKINSTLKLAVTMKHLDGTRDYAAPPLRTAPVFGGIAGIISSSEPASTTHGVASHANGDSAHDVPDGALPAFTSSNKELGEMQDMYRRTLAASLASQPGELKADECIEDIFAGGDGWGKGRRPMSAQSQPGSGTHTPNPDGDGHASHHRGVSGKLRSSGRGIFGMQKDGYSKYGHKSGAPRKGAGELDEMEVRENLVSWRISERAYT